MSYHANFMRYGVRESREFDTIEEALSFLSIQTWEGTLAIEDDAVTDDEGKVVATKDDVKP
jgi:hypothetical protein